MTRHTGQATKLRSLATHRTVKWLPRDDGFYLLAEVLTSTRAAPLVVMQEAILRVESHAVSMTGGAACGVLCGASYRDSRSGAEYLLVEDTERASRMDAEGYPAALLAAELSRAVRRVERAGRRVVGWYLFDVALDRRVPALHVGIHRALFPEPWQVALFRDGLAGEGMGAFMRVEPNEGRAFSIPFFELLPRKHSRGRGPRLTSVQWRNYSAESAAALLPKEAFVDRSVRPARAPEVERSPRTGSLLAGILERWSSRSSPRQPEPVALNEPRREPALGPELHQPQAASTEAPMEYAAPSPIEPPVLTVNPAVRVDVNDELPPEAPPDADVPPAPREAEPAAPVLDEVGAPREVHEVEAVFSEWRPEVGEHIVDRPFYEPRLWPATATTMKVGIGVAVLAAAILAAQGVHTLRGVTSDTEAGEVAPNQLEPRDSSEGRGARDPARSPAAPGSETPGQGDQIRAALTRIGEARAALQADLDSFNTSLLAMRGESGGAAACVRADSLYRVVLRDRARVDLAREELTGLVGPIRMAGLDSLSRWASGMQQQLRAACP